MVQINVVANLITRETSQRMGSGLVAWENLTRISWETSLALVCGQLFAPQSNVLCGCMNTRI